MTLRDDELGLSGYQGPDRIVHFTEFLKAKAASGQGIIRFESRFEKFEQQLQGLETGEVAVVTGYAKNGKTLFAESWLRSMTLAEPSICPVIFSFELQPEKLLAKYAADPLHPVFLPLQLKTMSFEWLYDRCVEAKLKHRAQAILIDHLHFLVDMNTKQNMSLNIGAFMRRLKHEIALGLNMAVILIAHQGQPREGTEASFGGMRDSSFIGQESDMTIIVSRRQDLNAVEAKEYEMRGVPWIKVEQLKHQATAAQEDKYSAGLATVKIAVARRSGCYDWSKLFRKVGNFVEEV
jgi:replicative DNA helicase